MKQTYLLMLCLCYIGYSVAVTTTDTGAGIIYKLKVTQDVALENAYSNHNSLEFLLVGKHPQFPNKQSLLQFENLPNSCSLNTMKWAKMYVYYVYAHKASWHTVQQTPAISRHIQVYQVKKSWNEAQATSLKRYNGANWSQQYLGLIGNDAGPGVITTRTVFSYRPPGFMEFDVTDAAKNWRSGSPNYGVLLRAENELDAGRGMRFYSNAHSDPKKHAFIHVLCDPNAVTTTTTTTTTTRSSPHDLLDLDIDGPGHLGDPFKHADEFEDEIPQ